MLLDNGADPNNIYRVRQHIIFYISALYKHRLMLINFNCSYRIKLYCLMLLKVVILKL